VRDEHVDVPSPIDLKSMADAEAWAGSAMVQRPYREEFFRAFVEQLRLLCSMPSNVLELGSGPGFLAQRILEAFPLVEYTALDFSPAMHVLAQVRLQPLGTRVRWIEADYKVSGWSERLPRYHAVVTMQAVHELRHKRHASRLYQAVRELLTLGGVFLMCDHFCGEGGMQNGALYMTPEEHEKAFFEGGFASSVKVRREGTLLLYRAEGAR
jgi:cyclopropane fatty-acyl-phospholipid synthase-like methyltransferase